jgi:hypothetical protein
MALRHSQVDAGGACLNSTAQLFVEPGRIILSHVVLITHHDALFYSAYGN